MSKLLSQIKKEVANGNVSAREFDGLTIYKYTDECNFSKAWNDINRQCRGLILDEKGQIFAHPFPKFFNLNEINETKFENLPLGEPFEVWDKADGSCGILYRHPEHGWRLATPGSMTSEQAEEGTKILHEKYSGILKRIPEGTTFVFEIISPLTKVVVDYGDSRKLILLAIRHFDGEEWHSSRVDRFAAENGLERPTRFESLDLQNPCFQQGKEGYVLKWDNGFRVKIKSPEYTQIHKVISYLNPKNVIELIQGKEYRDTIKILPKEFQIKFDDIRAEVQGKYDLISNEIERIYEQLLNLRLESRKEQALWILANAKEHSAELFGLLDNRFIGHIIWKKVISVISAKTDGLSPSKDNFCNTTQ